MVKRIVTAVAILLAIGCIERKTFSTSDSSDKVKTYLYNSKPGNMDHALDAKFEDKVVLLGYDLDKEFVGPGETFVVTWYWQCKEAPGPRWLLFTHLVDEENKRRLNRDRNGPIRKYFQPEYWRSGLFVLDKQEITVPKDWKSGAITLHVGLWKGSDRMSGVGKSVDDDDRAVGPTVVIIEPNLSLIKVSRTVKPPVIDGEFENEEAWKGAARLTDFKDTMTGFTAKLDTAVHLMWDEHNLYVAMQAEDHALRSRYQVHDDPLWQDDAFEIFLMPGGGDKNKAYYEVHVSPAGVIFDSYLPTFRKHQDAWSSNAVARVKLQGDLKEGGEKDKSWQLEMAIPFSSLDEGGDERGETPHPGDTWYANFYRVDKGEHLNIYSAWPPPLRAKLHTPSRFGQLTFIGKKPDQPSQ